VRPRREAASAWTNRSLLLEQAGSKRNGFVGHAKRDLAALVVETGHQAFRHQRTDLLGREVHNCHDQLAHQLLGLVERGDLGTRLLDAELVAKVDMQNIGWLTRLLEYGGVDDPAYAKFNFEEFVEADGFHTGLCHCS
jgi:hypothetical protein